MRGAACRYRMAALVNTAALPMVTSLTAGLWLSIDAVPVVDDGGDDPGFAEAFAQCRDGDAHGVGERVGVLIPRPFQELLPAP